jgi:hypothetical protein
MNPFRETEEYRTYQQFSLLAGVLTVGKPPPPYLPCSLDPTENVIYVPS